MTEEHISHHINWFKNLTIVVVILFLALIAIRPQASFDPGDPPANVNHFSGKLDHIVIDNYQVIDGKATAVFTYVGSVGHGSTYAVYHNGEKIYDLTSSANSLKGTKRIPITYDRNNIEIKKQNANGDFDTVGDLTFTLYKRSVGPYKGYMITKYRNYELYDGRNMQPINILGEVYFQKFQYKNGDLKADVKLIGDFNMWKKYDLFHNGKKVTGVSATSYKSIKSGSFPLAEGSNRIEVKEVTGAENGEPVYGKTGALRFDFVSSYYRDDLGFMFTQREGYRFQRFIR